MCFQETRLNAGSMACALTQARLDGRRLICGKAVTARRCSQLMPVSFPSGLKEWDVDGRVVAPWLPLFSGHRCILVLSVYGVAGSRPQKSMRTSFSMNGL